MQDKNLAEQIFDLAFHLATEVDETKFGHRKPRFESFQRKARDRSDSQKLFTLLGLTLETLAFENFLTAADFNSVDRTNLPKNSR